MRQRNLARLTKRAKPISSGIVDSQYLVGSFSPLDHSIRSHSFGQGSLRSKSRLAMRTRRRANRDLSGTFVPSRQVIVRQALAGRLKARSLTLIGRFALSRRRRLVGRPRPGVQALGGKGPVPGAHTVVFDRMPAT